MHPNAVPFIERLLHISLALLFLEVLVAHQGKRKKNYQDYSRTFDYRDHVLSLVNYRLTRVSDYAMLRPTPSTDGV